MAVGEAGEAGDVSETGNRFAGAAPRLKSLIDLWEQVLQRLRIEQLVRMNGGEECNLEYARRARVSCAASRRPRRRW